MPNLRDKLNEIRKQMNQVIIGKEQIIDFLLAALLSGGHVLIDDVPGVGKTTLAQTLAVVLGCSFRRIQFTPDLLPSDITGVSVYNQQQREFEIKWGPVMAQIVLADEINRTSPKTQAALLEAMAEGQVTIDGKTFPLPSPFFVIATQNPIEYEGTFPLPEAQLDRFAMRLELGYPTLEEEVKLLNRSLAVHPSTVTNPEEVADLKQAASRVFIAPSLTEYIVRLVQATRRHKEVQLGASPRATLYLQGTAKAYAFCQGRDYVLPDDIKLLARPVLPHRLLLRPEAELEGLTPEAVVEGILRMEPVPVIPLGAEGNAGK